jgi:hypothetical protein
MSIFLFESENKELQAILINILLVMIVMHCNFQGQKTNAFRRIEFLFITNILFHCI